MDPNPNSFPILSYVMSRLNSSKSRSSSYDNYDIEQPQIQSQPQPQLHRLNPHSVELIEQRMSPSLFASMASTVTDISQTRSILRNLGDRPDHEAVDAAKLRLADIDSTLASHLADVVRSSRPDGTDLNAWRSIMAEKEDQIRAKAEREKIPYRAVVQLDEMHEAYGRLLKEAEEKLVRIYDGEGGEESRDEEQARGGEEVNEEIVGILQAGAAVDRVELKGRGLRLLPEAFGRMRGLVSLDLSNNQLETISDSIAGLELLQELRVSNNLLVSLPDSIGMLLNLKILDVSGNKLKALPDSISKCRSLLELDASYNSLGFLPTNIGYELKSLRKLVVHLNKLRSLPTSVCEMTNLHILDVHFNELHGLPYSIGKLINLESLNLSSNFSDLRELPPTFGDLLNLRELDLSNNQIHALPDSFGRLDKLTKLNLDQNPLFLPPAEIVNQGVEAIKEYMAKRWLDILLEEEQKSQAQETPTKAGWLTRSTSMLSSVVTGISGYLISEDKSPRDPYLDREL